MKTKYWFEKNILMQVSTEMDKKYPNLHTFDMFH